jgi:NADH-quinone oxidoreductase subunit A
MSPLALAATIALFVLVGAVFVAVNLAVGRFVRPRHPVAEKEQIYECGEPTIGTTQIQFDLRFYVVALVFLVFEVEVAFFFPWATVFGTATTLTEPGLSADRAAALSTQLGIPAAAPVDVPALAQAGSGLAWLALFDLLVFFGVLLVGFAYLWRRGDIHWVRGVAGQPAEHRHEDLSLPGPHRRHVRPGVLEEAPR